MLVMPSGLSFRAQAEGRSRGIAVVPIEDRVILSVAKDPQRPDKGLSVGTMAIPRLRAFGASLGMTHCNPISA